MIAVVEADANQRAARLGSLDDRLQLGGAACGWLLDEHVLARVDRRERDLGEAVVRRRDDHDVDVARRGGVAPVGARPRTELRCERLRARQLAIRARDELRPAQRLRALLTDQATTDDPDVHDCSQSLPRSRAVIRRSV